MAIELPETILNYLLVGAVVLFAGFLVLMLVWSILIRLITNALSRSRLYFIPEILRGLTPSVVALSFMVSVYFSVLFTDRTLFENPLFKIWGILVIFVIVNILAKILLTSIDLYYKKVRTREMAPLYRSLPVIKSAVGIVLYTMALLLSIQVFSAEAGLLVSALAVLAVLFFFVIFYEQIRSIAAGFQLTGYYIEEGDLIELGGIRGFVEGIYGRSTLLRTIEGKRVAVPNYLFFKKPLTIRTRTNGIEFEVSVNGVPVAKAKDRIAGLATKIALALPDIPNEQKPKVFLAEARNGHAVFVVTVVLSEKADVRTLQDAFGSELANEFKDKLVGFRLL